MDICGVAMDIPETRIGGGHLVAMDFPAARIGGGGGDAPPPMRLCGYLSCAAILFCAQPIRLCGRPCRVLCGRPCRVFGRPRWRRSAGLSQGEKVFALEPPRRPSSLRAGAFLRSSRVDSALPVCWTFSRREGALRAGAAPPCRVEDTFESSHSLVHFRASLLMPDCAHMLSRGDRVLRALDL